VLRRRIKTRSGPGRRGDAQRERYGVFPNVDPLRGAKKTIVHQEFTFEGFTFESTIALS
jgi:hypothetical protein